MVLPILAYSMIKTIVLLDFDGDAFLGREDLRQMIDALTRKEMSDEEVEFIIERVELKVLKLEEEKHICR